MKNLGKGDKAKMGAPLDLGLNERSYIEGGANKKLRGETDEKSQRPTVKKDTVSSDRGSFKSEC